MIDALSSVLIFCCMQGPPSPATHEVPWKQVTSNDGSWLVQWRIIDEGAPAELPRVRKRFTLEVQVAPAGDRSAAVCALLIDAQMPEHLHGMNVAPTIVLDAPSPSGSHATAEGMLFHMSGRWEVDLDIDDGTTCERAQWNITLP